MNTPFHTPRVGDVVRESHALAQQQRRAPVSREVVALPAPGEVAYRSSLRRGLVVCVDLERWREVVRPETEGRPGWEVVRAAERLAVDPVVPGRHLSLLWDIGKKMVAPGRSFTVEWAKREMLDRLRRPSYWERKKAMKLAREHAHAVLPRIEAAAAHFRESNGTDSRPVKLRLCVHDIDRLEEEMGIRGAGEAVEHFWAMTLERTECTFAELCGGNEEDAPVRIPSCCPF